MPETTEISTTPMLDRPVEQPPTPGYTDRQMYDFFLSSRSGDRIGESTIYNLVEDPDERNKIIADHNEGLIETEFTKPEEPIESKAGEVRRMGGGILKFAATSVVKIDNAVNTFLDNKLDNNRKKTEGRVDQLRVDITEGIDGNETEERRGQARRFGGFVGKLVGLTPQGKLKRAEKYKEQLDDAHARRQRQLETQRNAGSSSLMRGAADRYLGGVRQKALDEQRAREAYGRDVWKYYDNQANREKAGELSAFSKTLDESPEMRRHLTQEIREHNERVRARHMPQETDEGQLEQAA